MDDIAYILWRRCGRWIAGFFAVLLVVGTLYGYAIGDVKKGLDTLYWKPVQTFSGWVAERIGEKLERRIERAQEIREQ